MSSSSIPHKSLKYMSEIAFRIAPLSNSQTTRSLRLVLSSIPFKASPSLADVPRTTLTTVTDVKEQRIDVTYSDKKKQSFAFANVSVADLIRKIEAPAKALRAKEEGIQ